GFVVNPRSLGLTAASFDTFRLLRHRFSRRRSTRWRISSLKEGKFSRLFDSLVRLDVRRNQCNCALPWPCMSALGPKRTFASQKVMSALPPKADMCGATRDVRFGPIADFVAMQPTAFEKGYRHSS